MLAPSLLSSLPTLITVGILHLCTSSVNARAPLDCKHREGEHWCLCSAQPRVDTHVLLSWKDGWWVSAHRQISKSHIPFWLKGFHIFFHKIFFQSGNSIKQKGFTSFLSCFLSKEDTVANPDPNSMSCRNSGVWLLLFQTGFCFLGDHSEPALCWE